MSELKYFNENPIVYEFFHANIKNSWALERSTAFIIADLVKYFIFTALVGKGLRKM